MAVNATISIICAIHEFSDDELKQFMSEISTDIEKWLEEESEGQP